MRFWAPALLLTACDGGSRLFLEEVWPEDDIAILIVTDESGRILEPTPIVIGEPMDRVLVESKERVVVYVQTFDALHDRNLEGCRFSEEEGDPLGAPSASWSSGVVSLDGAIDLEKQEQPSAFPLHLTACSYVSSCEALASVIEGPDLVNGLGGVATISDSTAVIVGGPRGVEDDRTLLLKVEGDTVVELAPSDRLTRGGIGLENDGAGLVGASDWELFRLDFEGRLVGTATLGFVALALDTGPDGTTLIAGKNGEIAALSRGSLEMRRLEPPPYGSLLEPIDPLVATVSADHFFLFGPDSNLYEWDGEWRELIAGEELTALGADTKSVLAIPDRGAALLYDQETKEWTPTGEAFIGVRGKRVTPFGDGRYLLVGQTGLIEYYNGDRMCVLLNADTRTLIDVDIAPSGRVAYIAGDKVTNALASGSILRVDLP